MTNNSKTPEEIANSLGCDLQPAAFGKTAIVVQGRWQEGGEADKSRVRQVRDALRRSGYADLADRALS